MSRSFLVFEKAQHELAIDTVHVLRILEDRPELSISLDPLFASSSLVSSHRHYYLLLANGSVLCIDEPKKIINADGADILRIPDTLQKIMYTKSISQVLCTSDSIIIILNPSIYLEEAI
ncbi:MAG: hypothetical protein RBR15_07435 [Sphaerochaeta sp.]|nr:hypothetical protein [Sphaerochaeta sp.]